jgi:hypothetical protein
LLSVAAQLFAIIIAFHTIHDNKPKLMKGRKYVIGESLKGRNFLLATEIERSTLLTTINMQAQYGGTVNRNVVIEP